MAETLTAGRLAKAGGVNVQTVRYYERRRLLLPVRRTDSGYRLYPPEAVRVLRFIKNAQDLGFTLEEIARLLRLRVGHKAQCGAVRRQAEARLKVVRGKLADLRAMASVLERLVRTCAAKGTTGSCPILDSLDTGGARR
jgi:MerR family mercuric resistance operon transcriptional regulator/MerR family gold-responsive transcriptional activator of gol and ges genes